MATPVQNGRADLHIHTSEGDGMASIEEILDLVEASAELDLIAITEHDDLRPALRARDRWARGNYSFEVVPGVELTTRSGHVIALFVEQPIRSFLTTDRTIAAIHQAGGIALVPHPLSWLTRSVGARVMTRLLLEPETAPDALEVSPSPAARLTARRADHLNVTAWHLPRYGGSDAHFPEFIGAAVTTFPGTSSGDLRAAIAAGRTQGELVRSVSAGSLGLRRIVRQQWRGLSVTPRKIIGPHLGRVIGRRAAP
jgi:predicted metal-dependent phosphoesterase TrpH